MADTGPRLTRRSAILALAALAAAPVGLSQALGAPTRRRARTGQATVYRLDPVHRPGPGRCTAGCAGCTACRRHARNKIFATAKAADAHRAHKHCKCRVVTSSLPAATYQALFGDAADLTRVVVDRRWDWVRDVLAKRRRAA